MSNENREMRSYVRPVVEVIVFDPHEDIVCTSGLTDGSPDHMPGNQYPRIPAREVESHFDL